MKKIKLIAFLGLSLFLSSCEELGGVLDALIVPNNTIVYDGENFNQSFADYVQYYSTCTNTNNFAIIASSQTTTSVISVGISNIPDTNNPFAVGGGGCNPRLTVSYNGSSVIEASSGSVTLNDNTKKFILTNIILKNGDKVSGGGDFK